MKNNAIEEVDYYFSTFNTDAIRLRERTLEGKWDEVKSLYIEDSRFCTININKSRGTALHVAVNDGDVEVVKSLVKAIIDHKMNGRFMTSSGMTAPPGYQVDSPLHKIEEPFGLKNERGDTALHLAAARGFKEICECLIGEEGERKHLIDIDNNEGETPLFHAALSWQKQTFMYLFAFKPPSNDTNYSYSRDLIRNNGDSILHCAIRREFFDLALIIMTKYPNLAVIYNEDGFSPLKLLATRTSAFKSGCKMSLMMSAVYHSIPVGSLCTKKAEEMYARKDDPAQYNRVFPHNYDTCHHFVYQFQDLLTCDAEKVFGNEHEITIPEESTRQILPPNYDTWLWFIKFACIYILGLSGVGVENIRKMKQKHKWSGQLLELFMEYPHDSYFGSGAQPLRDVSGTDFVTSKPVQGTSETGTPKNNVTKSETHKKKAVISETEKTESTISTAARHGVVEMVDKLISTIPSAIHETNMENKNILHVAIENRRTRVVEALRKRFGEPKRNGLRKQLGESKTEAILDNLMMAVDRDDNTVLHLAARRCDMRWHIAGAALQMMWNIKWFQYVRAMVPEHFTVRTNKEQKTACEIFKESHSALVDKGSEWLKDTSESCSVVAALLSGVSFATSSTVPGGNKGETGEPALEGKPAFDAFALASVVGLCFSVTALIMFLAILTSRKEAKDFRIDLPRKLLLGLTSLFVSIVAMFIAFCSGHIFLIDQKFKHVVFLIYTVTCLPVSLYAVAQLPLYLDLLKGILIEVPQTSDRGEDL